MERLLKSKFKIGSKIGENPFSLTYQGTTLSGEQPIIIKIYKRGTLNSILIKSMKQKVKALQELIHPGIARLLDGDYGWQGFYYVREYVEGTPLSKLLQYKKPDINEAEKWMVLICEALRAAHQQGIVHGALKPTNIFLDRGNQVKLTDFVIEGEIKESLPQKAQSLLEAGPYLSPEELLGFSAGISSDIYNAGFVLKQMLNGSKTVEAPLAKLSPAPTLPPNLPHYLEEILLKALQVDPLLRFHNMGDLIDSLKNKTIVEKQSLIDWPPIELENAPRAEEKAVRTIKSERKRSFFLLIVVLLATLAGVIYALINSFFLRQ